MCVGWWVGRKGLGTHKHITQKHPHIHSHVLREYNVLQDTDLLFQCGNAQGKHQKTQDIVNCFQQTAHIKIKIHHLHMVL